MSHSPLSIEVEPRYLADQSSPKEGIYTFAYTITITNTGSTGAQVIARHWLINDARGMRRRSRAWA